MEGESHMVEEQISQGSVPEILIPDHPEFKRVSVDQIYTVNPSQYQILAGGRNDGSIQHVALPTSAFSAPAYVLTTAADGSQHLQPLHDGAISEEQHYQIEVEPVLDTDESRDPLSLAPEMNSPKVGNKQIQAVQRTINQLGPKRNRPFKCDQCTASYIDELELEEHKSKHTDDGPFTCSDCHFTFLFKSHYKSHRTRCEKKRAQMPTPPSSFFVENVNHKFPRNQIKRPRDDVEDDKKPVHVKNINSNKFNPKKPSFKRVKRGPVSASRPFECDECEASFTTDAEFRIHKAKHTGEGPFKCEACSFVFLYKKLYEAHFRRCEKLNKKDGSTSTAPSESGETHSIVSPEQAQVSVVSPSSVVSSLIQVPVQQPVLGIKSNPGDIIPHQAAVSTGIVDGRQLRYELVPAVDGMNHHQVINLIKVKASPQ